MTLILDNYKLIFIHIPKNAGSSITEALKNFGGSDYGLFEHAKSEDIKWRLGKKYDEYTKFAVVRNPWAWIASMYFYLVKTNSLQVRGLDFEQYLKIRCTLNIETQSSYLREKIDHILRFETIGRSFPELMQNFGIDIKLPTINCSPISDYGQLYTPRLRAMLRSTYKEDINAFGYKFEDGLNTNHAAMTGSNKWTNLR